MFLPKEPQSPSNILPSPTTGYMPETSAIHSTEK